MSELGDARHFDRATITSGLPRLADIFRVRRHVSKVPATEVAASFDYLVGAAEQREWDGETERLCGLEVYNQLDLRRLHDRQVGRLLALENLPGVDADQTIIFRFIASVADYTAGRDKRAILVDCRHRMVKR
jgi:hypothetical protein